jgi:hypothetical protein
VNQGIVFASLSAFQPKFSGTSDTSAPIRPNNQFYLTLTNNDYVELLGLSFRVKDKTTTSRSGSFLKTTVQIESLTLNGEQSEPILDRHLILLDASKGSERLQHRNP